MWHWYSDISYLKQKIRSSLISIIKVDYRDAWLSVFKNGFLKIGSFKRGSDRCFCKSFTVGEAHRGSICDGCRWVLHQWFAFISTQDSAPYVKSRLADAERTGIYIDDVLCCASTLHYRKCENLRIIARSCQAEIDQIRPFSTFVQKLVQKDGE